MAELQAISAITADSSSDSFEKLKLLSKKIIDGEPVDIGLNIKSEIGELLKLIMETKSRIDEIEPTLVTSNKNIPNILKTLESVSETTEDATLTLMESADSLNNYYQEFISELEDLEDVMYKKDPNTAVRKIDKLKDAMENVDKLTFNILHALEFQDITEQKINKVISAVGEIGARIGAILGFIKLKQEKDPTTVDDASQEDIDKLLAEFGLD
jgi:chemotaxis regulatin CheY-phosphate phosphatase CheZ